MKGTKKNTSKEFSGRIATLGKEKKSTVIQRTLMLCTYQWTPPPTITLAPSARATAACDQLFHHFLISSFCDYRQVNIHIKDSMNGNWRWSSLYQKEKSLHIKHR
jgi:hypothetical protein